MFVWMSYSNKSFSTSGFEVVARRKQRKTAKTATSPTLDQTGLPPRAPQHQLKPAYFPEFVDALIEHSKYLDPQKSGDCAKFTDIDFCDWDFGRYNLSEVIFTRCHFTGANFEGTILKSTHFVGCDLRGAKGINVKAADLISADESTQLPTRVQRAFQAQRERKKLEIFASKSTRLQSALFSDFFDALVEHSKYLDPEKSGICAKFADLDFRDWDFSRYNLSEIIFTRCSFDRANFEGTMLDKTRFDDCNLRGAKGIRLKTMALIAVDETTQLPIRVQRALQARQGRRDLKL